MARTCFVRSFSSLTICASSLSIAFRCSGMFTRKVECRRKNEESNRIHALSDRGCVEDQPQHLKKTTVTALILPHKFSIKESQRDSALQPKVARNELPWVTFRKIHNPNGVAPDHSVFCSPASVFCPPSSAFNPSGGVVAKPGSAVNGAGGFSTTIFRNSSAAGKSSSARNPKYSRNIDVVP